MIDQCRPGSEPWSELRNSRTATVRGDLADSCYERSGLIKTRQRTGAVADVRRGEGGDAADDDRA